MDQTTSSSGPEPSFKPFQLSLPVDHSNASVHIHLSDLSARTVLLFLSTGAGGLPAGFLSTSNDASGGEAPTPATLSTSLAPLGTFVYALPSRSDPGQILTTPLYVRESSIDAITRVARVLAKRLRRPVYVGGELPVAGTLYGGPGEGLDSVEEETKVLRRVIDVVVQAIQGRDEKTSDAIHG
ncbi:MAG: hypothetical protein M4579_006089 [Chaenotheca gracillima]|nr:MAG: hypothetical protein M4579_006089 [Chaenotheca gracillima]